MAYEFFDLSKLLCGFYIYTDMGSLKVEIMRAAVFHKSTVDQSPGFSCQLY